jgi:hypothetical protein
VCINNAKIIGSFKNQKEKEIEEMENIIIKYWK